MAFIDSYKDLIEVLMKPTETLTKKKDLTIGEGFKYLFIGVLTSAIILSTSLMLDIGGLVSSFGSIGIGVGAGVLSGIVFIIFYLLIIIITWIVTSGFYWIITRILGCTKDFGNFAGVFGMIMGAIYLVIWIPLIGQVIGFYGIYLNYIMFTKAMDMKKDKAIMAILIPLANGLILIIIMIVLMISLFGAAMLT